MSLSREEILKKYPPVPAKTPYLQGCRNASRGPDANPYPHGSAEAEDWEMGRLDAMYDYMDDY